VLDAGLEVEVGVALGVVGVAVAVAVAVTVSVVETVALGDVAGVVGVGVMVSVAVVVLVAVGVKVTVAARLVRLLIALWALLLHPAMRQPMISMGNRTEVFFAELRIVVLPRRQWPGRWTRAPWP